MSRLPSWAARTARSLSAHLDRLRDTLDRLHGRLREAVADAVGSSVGMAAQDAVRDALARPVLTPSADGLRPGSSSRTWDDPDGHDPWAAREEDYRPAYWRDRPYRDEPDPYERGQPSTESPPTPNPPPDCGAGRWGLALAAGCQAAAWWLRRGAGRVTAWGALGVGLASAVAAYVAGPVIAAGAGLAGSALALTALSDAARAGAVLFRGGTD